MIGEQNNNIIIKKDLATNGIDPTMGIVPRTIMFVLNTSKSSHKNLMNLHSK